MEALEIDRIKEKLKIEPYLEKKKLYPIFKSSTPEEIDEIFSDEEILRKIVHNKDNTIMPMAFRYGGNNTQERLWQDSNNQKRLLGIGSIDDETLLNTVRENKFYHSTELEKKKKAGRFYFSKEGMRIFELFMRTIKSQAILDSLPSNIYYQMIILFSKKVPTQTISRINIPEFFYATVNGPLYPLATPKAKTDFCNFLNGYETTLLLPPDYLQIFTETKMFNYAYDTSDKKSLGHLLKNKVYLLKKEEKKFELTSAFLFSLSIREFMVLMDADKNVVDQEKLKEILIEFISKAIEDESILSSKYIDFEWLQSDNYFSIFQTIVKVMTSGEKCESLLSYLFDKLFQEHYTEEEKKEIYPLLKNCLLNANKQTICSLFFRPTDLKSMFFVRYGLSSRYMDYLNGISPMQILRLNVKHINKLASFLEDETQDEISDIYSKAIKLYCAVGLERAVAILEGTYGKVTKQFLDNVSKLIVKDSELKRNGRKYEPIPHPGFSIFLFQSGQVNHLFDKSNMAKSWYYLFNQFDELKELCHGHLTFPKVEIILKEKLNTVNYPIPPNCHSLEDVIGEIGIGNKTKHSNNEIYAESIRILEQQLKRTTSSIPYVEGKLRNGYRFETMKLHDVIGYVLGYRASCCIRVLDIAHKHLLHALLCESGRILIIYDSDNNPVAFSPLKRNGELLIANSIELIAKSQHFSDQNLFDKSISAIQDAFMEGIMAIINRSKEEEEKEFIKVATIGRESYNKPESTQWPSDIPTPTILEKKDPIYRETDEYHKQLNILYQEPKCFLSSLVYGKSKIHYQDPRASIQACDFKNEGDYLNQQKALNVVNGINYELLSEEEKKDFKRLQPHGIECIFFAEDWYVVVTTQHLIDNKCLSYDERAKKEMNATIALVKEAIATKGVKQLVLSMQKKES